MNFYLYYWCKNVLLIKGRNMLICLFNYDFDSKKISYLKVKKYEKENL